MSKNIIKCKWPQHIFSDQAHGILISRGSWLPDTLRRASLINALDALVKLGPLHHRILLTSWVNIVWGNGFFLSQLVCAANIFPEIIGVFENCIVYRYAMGKVLKPAEIFEEKGNQVRWLGSVAIKHIYPKCNIIHISPLRDDLWRISFSHHL